MVAVASGHLQDLAPAGGDGVGQAAHHLLQRSEVVGRVDGPALVAERLGVAQAREGEALGPPVDERGHVLALGRVGRLRRGGCEGRGADHLHVEPVGVRAQQGVRRVVGPRARGA